MVEREWREASDMRPSKLGLAVVIGTAALLRFWSITQGLPHTLHDEEPAIMSAVVQIMRTGDFNPHWFAVPSLYVYVQLALACGRFLIGAAGGLWTSVADMGPEALYAWGRGLSAVLGTLTVVVVYQIAMRWGARHALLAAGILAVMPIHVRESHYVTTTVPATLLTALALLLALRAHERGTAGNFARAGAMAGLAAATSYSAAWSIVMPIVAAWMTLGTSPTRLTCMLAAAGAAILAFLTGAPYSLVDLPAFLDASAALAGTYHAAPLGADAIWRMYVRYLTEALGWPALLLLVSGVVLAIVRATSGPGRVRWTLLLVFPFVYFYAMAAKSEAFAHDLTPIAPFVSILVAVTVVSGVSLLRRFDIPRAPRTALIVGLTVASLLPPALRALSFDRRMSRPTTRAMAYSWVQRNIPRGSRVVIEHGALHLPAGDYRTTHVPRLIELAPQDVAPGGQATYLIASGDAYGPIFEAPERRRAEYDAYLRLFEGVTALETIKPSRGMSGPELRIFKRQ